MKVKLITTGRVAFCFCGKVAVTYKNTKDNPVEIEIEDLEEKEIVGLSRALRSGVIKAEEGSEAFDEALKNIIENKKSLALKKIEAKMVQEEPLKEEEETKEVEEEILKELPEEVPEKEVVVEEVQQDVKKTPTRRRRTSTAKKSENEE